MPHRPFASLRVRVPRQRLAPLRQFLSTEAAGGAVLVAAALVAVVWANSPWRASYDDLWGSELSIVVAGHRLAMDLRHWVSDGLMAVFFLVVGLEIKRELVDGELREARHAVLPIVAAVGGMAVPALLYVALNAGRPGADGWGVPMATDIALALAVLGLVRPAVPERLTLFLLALAIVDDIGAVIVIAVFYSGGIDVVMLLLAIGAIAGGVAARVLRIRSMAVYVALGGAGWLALHESGVHATLMGLAFGLLAPTSPHLPPDAIDTAELVDVSTVEAAHRTVALARQSTSMLEWLEYRLHPWSTFVVLPLFAIANAGVHLSGEIARGSATSRVTWGVVLGLVVGKAVGITGAAWLAVKTRVAALPEGVTIAHVAGVAVLGGIGFTVSLFVTELAFPDRHVADQARVGIFVASILAGVAGAALLRTAALRRRPSG